MVDATQLHVKVEKIRLLLTDPIVTFDKTTVSVVVCHETKSKGFAQLTAHVNGVEDFT